MTTNLIDKSYQELISTLKQEIRQARVRTHLAVNKELILLYWNIGKHILERQQKEGWGSKVIENISKDLRNEFPEMRGFSPQNLKYMRKFAEEYTLEAIGQQFVDQLPWGHIVVLIYQIMDKEERQFYINGTIENGWSRDSLNSRIETNLYQRQGKAITNFKKRLPLEQSSIAHETLKNPYFFDFLSLGQEAQEREIEKGLMAHIEKFLLELGEGFAFVGRQYHLQIERKDFYIDLLFYHVKLRSYIVIELKTGQFKPEYAGKMNFYLSAVDDLLRNPGDNPSIGLILCKSKVGVVAEYALRDMTKPIGLAEYRLKAALPDNIKTALPTVEELEAELLKIVD